jgi:phospholipid transport system substrate-binding protein
VNFVREKSGSISGIQKHIRLLGLTIICLAIAASAAVPQTMHDNPRAFVDNLGKRTISYLADKESPFESRREKLRTLLLEGFAVERIGRFVLGKYRRMSEPQAVDEFVEVFEGYIVNFYAAQFSRYSGESLAVQKVLKKARARDSMVMTHILTGDGRQPLRVDFQVRNVGDKFKIMDVRVEGISMVLAQRDEFTTYIGNNGGKIQTLTAALRKRMERIPATAGK